jgi:hypothetical protein
MSFGEVYKANDTRLDRIVALKVLPEALAADPQFCGRLTREAKSISALSHPNICTLFDVGSTGSAEGAGGPHVDYLVTEYLEGAPLAARLERGALPSTQVRDPASQTLAPCRVAGVCSKQRSSWRPAAAAARGRRCGAADPIRGVRDHGPESRALLRQRGGREHETGGGQGPATG